MRPENARLKAGPSLAPKARVQARSWIPGRRRCHCGKHRQADRKFPADSWVNACFGGQASEKASARNGVKTVRILDGRRARSARARPDGGGGPVTPRAAAKGAV